MLALDESLGQQQRKELTARTRAGQGRIFHEESRIFGGTKPAEDREESKVRDNSNRIDFRV